MRENVRTGRKCKAGRWKGKREPIKPIKKGKAKTKAGPGGKDIVGGLKRGVGPI